jgi:hypothetical protein
MVSQKDGDEVDGQAEVKEMRWMVRERDERDEVNGQTER